MAQGAMFHLANSRHNDTHTGFKKKKKLNMARWATPGANGHPMAVACGHRAGRCEMFFPVVGVYEHLHARLRDFNTHLQFNVNASSAADGENIPVLEKIGNILAASGIRIYSRSD